MKVILREHVEHLGRRGEIVNVAQGYARNYLVPKGLALSATPGNLKQVEHRRRVWAAQDAKEQQEAEALARRIGALGLSFTRKAGESGTLYGSVTNSEIAEAIAGHGIRLERRKIALAAPVKTVGTHLAHIRLHPKVVAEIRLEVVAEPGSEAAAAAEEPPAEEQAAEPVSAEAADAEGTGPAAESPE